MRTLSSAEWIADRSTPIGDLTVVRDDAGMTTAEYAVGTIAAVAFAAVLYKVVQSGVVQSALTAIIQSALHTL